MRRIDTSPNTAQQLCVGSSQFVDQVRGRLRGFSHVYPRLLRDPRPIPRFEVKLKRAPEGRGEKRGNLGKRNVVAKNCREMSGPSRLSNSKRPPTGDCRDAGGGKCEFLLTSPNTSSICAPGGALVRSISTFRCARTSEVGSPEVGFFSE